MSNYAESTPLMAKVMGLLSPTLAAAGAGAYLGQNLRGWLPVIGLGLLSIAGLFIISAPGSGNLALLLLLGWGVVNGMILGPLVAFALAAEGPRIVLQALLGTTTMVMGLIAFGTGINFSFLLPLLFFGLMVLPATPGAGLVMIHPRRAFAFLLSNHDSGR